MSLPRRLACASTSAFLLALGLPNELFLYGYPILGALALIPLYLALRGSASWAGFFVTAGTFGALAHAFSSYWLYFFHGFAFWTLGSTTVAYFVVYGVYGLYLGFFLSKAGSLRPLAFAFAWVALEYAKSTGFLGYPWGLLSYTQTSFLPMIQIADVTGVYGPSFVLAFLNASLAELGLGLGLGRERARFAASQGPSLGQALAILGLAVLVLAANLGYGAWSLAHPVPRQKGFTALIVQQNLDPWEAGEEEGLRINIDLAKAELGRAGAKPDLILFSESTLSRPFQDNPAWFASHPREDALIPFIRASGAWLITGAPVVLDWEKEEVTNSVILIDPLGRQVADYAKIHPVPFAEAIPFWDFLPFRHFIQKVVGLESGWTMGTKYTVFTLPTASGEFTFGAPICFEDAFPELCRGFFRQNVDLLVNLTNDSWSKTRSSEIQHFAAARFRAIEARKTLLRSTNGGLSAVVDAEGRIVEALPLFTAQARRVEVPISRPAGQTVYVRLGDWFSWTAIILSALLFLFLWAKPLRAGS